MIPLDVVKEPPMETFSENTVEKTTRLQPQAKERQARAAQQSASLVDEHPQAQVQAIVQQMADDSPQVQQIAQLQAMADSKRLNRTGLPDDLKAGIENLSGYSMDDVRVHYNSDKTASLQAHAYAQGADIHLAPGQEKHLPHEAWHVVQQKQGRVKPTMQMKGGINVNDDAGLEQEADVMGAEAFRFGGNHTKSIIQQKTQMEGTNNSAISNRIVQRILVYNAVQYKSMKDLAGAADKSVFKLYMSCKDPKKKEKLDDKEKIYDLSNLHADIIQEVSGTIEKTDREKLDEFGASKIREITLEKRIEDYPEGATLYAPINKAIIVINDGQYQFVGTSGLIGCVEVMIECHTETDKGYLVAHVSSEFEDDVDEIERQLGVMLAALSDHLGTAIDWSAFKLNSKTHKLTLVRNAKLGEQRLLINMRNILASSGAEMNLVNSNSASMEVTVRGAMYYDNMREGLSSPPKTDYRKTEGYPFPEED